MKERMRKCRKAAVLAVFIVLGFWINASLSHDMEQVDAASDKLNIYGIYLAGGSEGDATLLESNGEFLLMDLGKAAGIPSVKRTLKEQQATKISLYISHYHADHYGGSEDAVAYGIRELIQSGISIETLYLPDPTIAQSSQNENTNKHDKLKEAVEDQGGRVIELRKGSRFRFGSVSAEVIGPIEGLTMKQCGNEKSVYENNHSLVTMMTFGKTKFFTAGDIQAEQEKLLVEEYGAMMKADIMKLSHHGTSSANSEEILKCIQPTYTFGLNTNHTALTDNGHQETFGSKERVYEYGICYMTGEEKKTIHMQVVDGLVSLYSYQNGADGKKMSGWVTLKGGDGKYYKTNKFYLDTNGKPLTGLQKLDGKYYYLGNGGCMQTGHYDKKTGAYNPWTSFGKKVRYIYKDGHMAMGFVSIKNRLSYFDKEGFKLDTNKQIELKKIEGKYYAVIKGGVIYTNNGKGGFRKLPDGYRYFNGKGVMQTGWKKFQGAKYYLDKKTGCRVTGFKKISGTTYYFNKGGQCKRTIDTKKVAQFKGISGKGSITFTWKKNGNVKGYEIYLSTKKNSGYKRKIKIDSRSVTKCTIEKLSRKKTYYAKICTYTIANGETCKGDFGRPIAIKVK